jgi:hypothetical protein
LKSELKKKEINYLCNEGHVFSNLDEFSCRVNGKVLKEKRIPRNRVWVKRGNVIFTYDNII